MRLIIILALLTIPFASAATIQGAVYDFSLDPVNALIEINTTPAQKIVGTSYSFEVDPGTYKLTAQEKDGNTVIASTDETVTVNGDGTFTVDLIMFPEVDVNESLEVSEPGPQPGEFNYLEPIDHILSFLALLSVLLIVVALHYSHQFRMKHSATSRWEDDLQLDEDASEILEFIDSKKRVTQKEIRSQFRHSASKISLIITELEEKGLVKKIKRGRGNVIIRN